MAYEVFKRTRFKVDEPTLTITPEGRLYFNAAAGRALMAAGIRTVLLLWDTDTNQFAVKATPKRDRNGYAVTFIPSRSSASLRAKSFLHHIGWAAKKRETFPATWNEDEKMLETVLPAKFIGAGKRGQ